MQIDSFLSQFGIPIKVLRSGSQILETVGLDNIDKQTRKHFYGVKPGTDIKTNDVIVNPAGEEFFVIDTKTIYFQSQPYSLNAYYESASEHQHAQDNRAVYNIENAYSSVIGTGNSVVINYGDAIREIKQKVEQTDSPDKDDLSRIVSLLEMIVNNQIPPSKGLFAKFSEVMERNSWIVGSVTSAILGWLMSQIP